MSTRPRCDAPPATDRAVAGVATRLEHVLRIGAALGADKTPADTAMPIAAGKRPRNTSVPGSTTGPNLQVVSVKTKYDPDEGKHRFVYLFYDANADTKRVFNNVVVKEAEGYPNLVFNPTGRPTPDYDGRVTFYWKSIHEIQTATVAANVAAAAAVDSAADLGATNPVAVAVKVTANDDLKRVIDAESKEMAAVCDFLGVARNIYLSDGLPLINWSLESGDDDGVGTIDKKAWGTGIGGGVNKFMAGPGGDLKVEWKWRPQEHGTLGYNKEYAVWEYLSRKDIVDRGLYALKETTEGQLMEYEPLKREYWNSVYAREDDTATIPGSLLLEMPRLVQRELDAKTRLAQFSDVAAASSGASRKAPAKKELTGRGKKPAKGKEPAAAASSDGGGADESDGNRGLADRPNKGSKKESAENCQDYRDVPLFKEDDQPFKRKIARGKFRFGMAEKYGLRMAFAIAARCEPILYLEDLGDDASSSATAFFIKFLNYKRENLFPTSAGPEVAPALKTLYNVQNAKNKWINEEFFEKSMEETKTNAEQAKSRGEWTEIPRAGKVDEARFWELIQNPRVKTYPFGGVWLDSEAGNRPEWFQLMDRSFAVSKYVVTLTMMFYRIGQVRTYNVVNKDTQIMGWDTLHDEEGATDLLDGEGKEGYHSNLLSLLDQKNILAREYVDYFRGNVRNGYKVTVKDHWEITANVVYASSRPIDGEKETNMNGNRKFSMGFIQFQRKKNGLHTRAPTCEGTGVLKTTHWEQMEGEALRSGFKLWVPDFEGPANILYMMYDTSYQKEYSGQWCQLDISARFAKTSNTWLLGRPIMFWQGSRDKWKYGIISKVTSEPKSTRTGRKVDGQEILRLLKTIAVDVKKPDVIIDWNEYTITVELEEDPDTLDPTILELNFGKFARFEHEDWNSEPVGPWFLGLKELEKPALEGGIDDDGDSVAAEGGADVDSDSDSPLSLRPSYRDP